MAAVSLALVMVIMRSAPLAREAAATVVLALVTAARRAGGAAMAGAEIRAETAEEERADWPEGARKCRSFSTAREMRLDAAAGEMERAVATWGRGRSWK